MLKENAFVLTDSCGVYHDFISLLKGRYVRLEIHSQCEELIKNIESTLSGNLAGDDNLAGEGRLLILFVEFPFLNSISEYLAQKSGFENYILVAFNSENAHIDSGLSNVFEFINTAPGIFDEHFFFKKLDSEISNKSRISLLQLEVKEFYEIGKSLSSEKDTVKLLEMIINSSMSLTSSDAGTIYLVVDNQTGNWSSISNNTCDGKHLKFVIAKNTSMDIRLESSTTPITRQSISGYTIITGRSVRIDDAYKLNPGLDYRHDRRYDLNTGYITRSILSIPMKDYENNVMGVIQLINKKKSKNEKLDFNNTLSLENIIPYDYTDELIMNSLAGQAAIALENNLLYRDMHNLLQSYKSQNSQLEHLSRKILKAHEEERKRIAREIHDGPAQSVVNLSLKLELCKKHLQNNDHEKFMSGLSSLNDSIRGAAKEIRTIIYDLKPSYLEDGLLKALENHFHIFKESTGINIIFTTSEADAVIEYYMASTIYRIVQEALTNINKHAEASEVTVDFAIKDKYIILTITDNGKGFDSSRPESRKKQSLEGGFGLEGMRERVELMKGSMTIKSEIGKGTCITINIPLLNAN